MPIDARSRPAWWVRTILVVVFLALSAGQAWGKGWWQNRWTGFGVGLFYMIAILAISNRQPDRSVHSRWLYFGLVIFFMVVSVRFFTMFFLGGEGFAGTLAFIMLTFFVRCFSAFGLRLAEAAIQEASPCLWVIIWGDNNREGHEFHSCRLGAL